MTINKVSFGKIVDIKYVYRTGHSGGRKKCEERFAEDKKNLEKITEKRFEGACVINGTPNRSVDNRHVEFEKTNRLITGDDMKVFITLRKLDADYAEMYAGKNAQTIYYRAD